jgi:hypothetical protein
VDRVDPPDAGEDRFVDLPFAPTGWHAWRRHAPVAALLAPPGALRRSGLACRPTGRALVLGSGQLGDAAEQAAAEDDHGPPRLRRRSGGAAVLVSPGNQCWLDVFLPPGDALLESDVARSAWWLGELWIAALRAALGEDPGLAVHRGPAERNAWSRRACFAALGPGEVTLEGRKLVGISQRRGSWGAWLHSMAHIELRPSELAALVGRGSDERVALERHLALGATGLAEAPGAPLRWDEGALALLEQELVARLPAGLPVRSCG